MDCLIYKVSWHAKGALIIVDLICATHLIAINNIHTENCNLTPCLPLPARPSIAHNLTWVSLNHWPRLDTQTPSNQQQNRLSGCSHHNDRREARPGDEPTCVGAPTDAKVPAGGDVHGLGEITGMTVCHAAASLAHGPRLCRPTAAAGHQSQLALLQIHILVY